MEKPNIVLFITHDQGQFLKSYDTPDNPNSLKTPNLDKIAKEGVRFTNHFCTAPQCSPSRGSIQTSLYPHQNGLMGLVNVGWTLPEHNKTLPMYIKENGYTTHLIGLQHEVLEDATLGYDTVSKRSRNFLHYSSNKVLKTSEKFFTEHKNDDKPFFVNIGTIDVHRPFRAWADPVDPKTVTIPPFLPDNEMIREDIAEYYGTINNVDINIGKLMEYLAQNELIENTVFIYTTDHGSPLPRAKCTLYDPGIKTALIMYMPNSELFSGGKVIDCMLSNIDLLPTLLDIIGAEIPKNIEGISFIPILNSDKEQIREEIFAEKTFHELYDPIRCIRTQNYKYIKNFRKLETLYQIPIDILEGPSGKYMKTIIKKPRAEEELYDLKNDPHEENNIVNNPECKEIANSLRKKLENWMKRTNDPLLKGKVEPQSRVNFDYQI